MSLHQNKRHIFTPIQNNWQNRFVQPDRQHHVK